MENLNFEEINQEFIANLNNKQFQLVREKIDSYLGIISQKIKELENYFFKMGSKKDNTDLIASSDSIIVYCVKIFTETFNFINLYNNHKFNNRSEKIENIQIIIRYDKQINELKNKFDDITNKIRRQDLALIESTRNSKLSINEYNSKKISGKKKDSNVFNVEYMKGVEMIDHSEYRERQVNMIDSEREKLNRLSIMTTEGIQKEKLKVFDDQSHEIYINKEKIDIRNYLKEEKPEYYFDKIGLEVQTNKNKYIIMGVGVILFTFFLYLIL